MKPDRLLQHFEQVAEAPDAVPRLRRFILDLAVRGKLVEQDPSDEPAAELLKRIEAEKARLIKAGEMRPEKPSPPKSEDDVPFQVPRNWQWSRLAGVGFVNPRNDAEDGLKASFVPMTLISADYGVANGHEIRPWGEIKSGYTHFAEGDVALAKITPCFENGKSMVLRGLTGGIGAGTTELHVLRPALIDPDYVLIFLKCPHFIETGIPRMTGTAGQKRVPAEYFSFSPFPLPPLAEQHRIVAQVDELMALCDELEAAQAKRERRRDRLVVATLHGLNNGDESVEPGTRPTFENSARFYFNHLPRLTARPEHIHQLRQTILALAVRGKLVEQDPEDAPASILLADIVKGRERAIEVLGLRRQTALPEVRYVAPPFGAPNSWVWSLVDDCFVVTGGIQKTPRRTPRDNAFPYVGVANVYRGRLDLSEVKQFELNEGELEKLRLEENDLLIVEGNGSASEIGRCARWTGELSNCVHQNHIIRCRPGNPAISRFTELYLNSGIAVEAMRELAVTSAGLYNLSVGKIRKIRFPLPPLTEQHRIVAKVDELMALCDDLEVRLTATATTRRQLLEASLHEALEGES